MCICSRCKQNSFQVVYHKCFRLVHERLFPSTFGPSNNQSKISKSAVKKKVIRFAMYKRRQYLQSHYRINNKYTKKKICQIYKNHSSEFYIWMLLLCCWNQSYCFVRQLSYESRMRDKISCCEVGNSKRDFNPSDADRRLSP